MKCNNEIQCRVRVRVRVVVLNATFNNISVRGGQFYWGGWGTGENRRSVADKLDHIMFYRVHLTWVGFDLTTLMMICTNILCLHRFLLLFLLLRHHDCCRVTYCYSTFLFHYYYYSFSSSTHLCPLDFSEMPWSNYMKLCEALYEYHIYICHVKLCF